MTILRIGNAGGYWGDDPDALQRQIHGGKLDYITMDFLAEITMSILRKKWLKDPTVGYAADFISMLEPVVGALLANKTKLITNAGGVNPVGCARKVWEISLAQGLRPKIAVVCGDDILGDISALASKGCDFANMETGESLEGVGSRLVSANVYFGAQPVVEALRRWDPDIIITGRVTDTGITVAPMIHEFGWEYNDWDRLAAGIVAGHLIECGSQVTGGNCTDWETVASFDQIGFPIIEMSSSGTFTVSKHPGSGGVVTEATVKEQLFYEMGDPGCYISPDVVADFGSVRIKDCGSDRVEVSNVVGCQPTPFYKVSMAYQDGYKCIGSIVLSGPQARKKAQTMGDIFWRRVDKNTYLETSTEYLGWNACHRSLSPYDDAAEILLRLGVRSNSKGDLRAFAKMIPALLLSGPPGVGVIEGVPPVREIIRYWPALVDKSLVKPQVSLVEDSVIEEFETVGSFVGEQVSPAGVPCQVATDATMGVARVFEGLEGTRVFLSDLGYARSGDKGDMANIGVCARSSEAYAYLKEYLTAQVVKNLFQDVCDGSVERYELDGLHGLNFLLNKSLGGGGSCTLRTDAQGKTFAQALCGVELNVPESVIRSLPRTC